MPDQLPDVHFSRTNGNLGRVEPTADNVFLLVLSGAAVAGKINLLEPKPLTSSTQIATTYGITNAVIPNVAATCYIIFSALGNAGAEMTIKHGNTTIGNFSHWAADTTFAQAAIRLANNINSLNIGYTAAASGDDVILTAPANLGAVANGTTLEITSGSGFIAAATAFAGGVTGLDNSLAYQELVSFYANAPEGTKVYIMLYSPATLMADMCNVTNANGIKKALDQLEGEVSAVYINKKLPAGYTVALTNGLDSDVWNAAANLQALLEDYQKRNMPLLGALPGLGFAKANVANLADLTQRTNNMLSIILGSDSSAGVTCMGRLAGWESKMPVQHNISRVKYGSVLEQAYFLDGTPVKELTAYLGDLHGKGYIFFRKILRKSGYFYNGDNTAVSASDDYCSRSWNRTINKAQRIAYDVLIEHLNDDVETDTGTGGISPALASNWEGEVENNINVQMVRTGNISGVKCNIDPSQVNLQTDRIAASLQIVRKGQAKNIDVQIGYATAI